MPDIPANSFLEPAGPDRIGTNDSGFVDLSRPETLTTDSSDAVSWRAGLAFSGLFLSAMFAACAQSTQVPPRSLVAGFEQPARLVRAKGWAFDHGVRVWLPPSYKSSRRTFAAAQTFSTVAGVAERLTVRKYRSLELAVRIFPDKDHLTIMPVAYAQGVRYLWAK